MQASLRHLRFLIPLLALPLLSAPAAADCPAGTNVIIVRHGEKDGRGDKPLTECGKSQAALLGEKLRLSGCTVDTVYFSSRNKTKRHEDTAKLAAMAFSLEAKHRSVDGFPNDVSDLGGKTVLWVLSSTEICGAEGRLLERTLQVAASEHCPKEEWSWRGPYGDVFWLHRAPVKTVWTPTKDHAPGDSKDLNFRQGAACTG